MRCRSLAWRGLGLWIGVVVLGTPRGGLAQAVPPRFDPRACEAHVRFLSSDLLEGRGIATRGGELAAAYIEAIFRVAGLRPGFGDSFRQPFGMTAFSHDPGAQVVATVGAVGMPLRIGEDITVLNQGWPADVVTDELLFVGYGIHAPREGWDDYRSADVRGRLLLAFVNEPGRDDPRRFRGRALTLHGRWTTKLEEAARRGAAGMMLIHTDADAGYGWSITFTSLTHPRYRLQDEPLHLVTGWIAEGAIGKLLTAAGLRMEDLRAAAERPDFRPRTLPVRLRIQAQCTTQVFQGQNVVGVLPGERPGTIVLSAHYDHLGIGPDLEGDRIYNGAVDNGSALAVLLVLAQGLATTPAASRPTLVFAAVDAEEEGLLGSTHYTRHPALPLATTLANINFEMTNVWGRTRDVVGIGAEHSELQALLAGVASRRGLRVSPDEAPEQGFFFRSDQLAFARAGVPSMWLDAGTDYEGRAPGWGAARRAAYRTDRYHRPSDEIGPDWDWQSLVQIAEVSTDLIDAIAAAGAVHWLPGSELAPPSQ